jgi:hypothetical protein
MSRETLSFPSGLGSTLASMSEPVLPGMFEILLYILSILRAGLDVGRQTNSRISVKIRQSIAGSRCALGLPVYSLVGNSPTEVSAK